MELGIECVVANTNGRRPGSDNAGATRSATASANQPLGEGRQLHDVQRHPVVAASATPTSSRYCRHDEYDE